jgi:MFS family permease
VAGPLLVPPTGAWSAAMGWGELAGPFVAALLAFAAAAACFALFLHPEPRELAARLETAGGDPRDLAPPRPLRELTRDPGVVTAFATLVLAQAVMIMLMGITSLHMHVHDHGLPAISAVFSGHTLGMFAFSLVSGWATDRFGRVPVLAVGGVLLLVSCLLAPLSPAFVPIFVALFLLGYGWNLCYVAGSALLADHLSTAEKAATQGVADLALGGVSALSTLVGGVVFAAYGFTAMSMAGAVAAVVLLLVVVRYRAAAPALAG